MKLSATHNGHASQINSLSFNEGVIVSSAQDDRSISVMHAKTSRVLMCDVSIIQIGIQNNNVFGLAEDGNVYLWDLSQSKQMQPSGSITITLDNKHSKIKSCRFIEEDIEIVYGHSKLLVERVKLSTLIHSLTRTTQSKQAIKQDAIHNPSKTLSANPIEKTFQEIISEQEPVENVKPERPNANSLTTLLQQGLHTNDITLLQQAFAISQPSLIASTLQRLSVTLIPALLKTMCELLGKPNRINTLLAWFRCLLAVHTSVLTTHAGLLKNVQGILNERVKNNMAVHMLNGKLSLVLGKEKELAMGTYFIVIILFFS